MAHLPFPRSRGQPGTLPGLDCCHALRNISVTLLLSLKCLQTKPHTRFAAQKARVWCGFHVCVSSTGRSVSIPGPLLPAGRAGAAGLHPAGRLLVTTAEAGRPSRSGVSDGSISAHVCLCARARGGGGRASGRVDRPWVSADREGSMSRSASQRHQAEWAVQGWPWTSSSVKTRRLPPV